MYLAVAAIVLLLVGTVSGFLLVMRPVSYRSQAWDCGNYIFAVDRSGIVSATNGSTQSEPVQRAEVYVDNVLLNTFDVPSLNPGATVTLGNVVVPTETFTWQVKGTSDCSNAGRFEKITSYQCRQIKAYDENDVEIATASLSTLKAGDIVRLAATGSGSASDYTAARFTINGTLLPETSLKMTSSNDYYVEYTIPANTSSFDISAQLKAVDGQWY